MKRIRTDSEKLQRFRLVLRFSQEQPEKDTVCSLKCAVKLLPTCRGKDDQPLSLSC